ncbi:hypothetical protein AYO20_09589 [Fonsecaea nubica]|uniref:Transketolase-like pyrimidine-binding domain-containing protein n=1 Tax=Fonsecaea nubica TaxID=856822 RepID=A0A178CDY2_9EURO|nr:hypothetical protein AYO20_09589 [Fonsecaea nubica]OAL28170.1 hypothetical protein AYO20_09589 [Fonsecaea nubica]
MAKSHAVVNGVASSHEYTQDELVVRDIRKLVIDCCRQNGGGHGGSAIGMAPLAVALWGHAMRYNPKNPFWFDRDRFVLSNGHAAILLYVMLHVTGYAHMTMDELKLYASAKGLKDGKWQTTLCHAHPENEVPGVEVTTGPLGQGIANAVGLAIASKHMAARYNRDGFEITTSRIYVTSGDGCLQEGVAQEALALAGHLKLDNLCLCYDNNAITCDGPLDWISTEDTNAKMRALGWNVIDVFTGDTSVEDIVAALRLAKSTNGKPTFINIRTTIGYGSATAGTAKAHHGTFTDEDLLPYLTHSDGINQETHHISAQVKQYFDKKQEEGRLAEQVWNDRLKRYMCAFPEEGAELTKRLSGEIEFKELLSKLQAPSHEQSTRQANGFIFNKLLASIPHMMPGGADLWNSNALGDQSAQILDAANPGGRVVRYGIREHAMASIANGLAAYSEGAILPTTATFLMFYLYAAPGVRMGALSHFKVIHIATHDSIGEGQNGPTHQAVELDSLYRAMPNFLFIRPADGEEVIGAWLAALSQKRRPSMISVARDPATAPAHNTNRHAVLKGGYVLQEENNAIVTLISCGSELQFAVQAAARLTADGIATRVVSMPCVQLFSEQSEEYKDSVLSETPYTISAEAYISTIWARYCNASIAMDSFGFSGGSLANYGRFGLDTEGVYQKVTRYVNSHRGGKKPRRWTLLK